MLALFLAVVVGAAALLDPHTVSNVGVTSASSRATLREILGRNLPACLLLYSGVLTLGFTAVLGVVGVAAFVGATVRVDVDAVGWQNVVGSTWTYVFLECAGIVVAGAAGIYPITSTIVAARRGDRPRSVGHYVSAFASSLGLLAASVLFIVIAATIEALVIARR